MHTISSGSVSVECMQTFAIRFEVKHFDLQFGTFIQTSIHNELVLNLFPSLYLSLSRSILAQLFIVAAVFFRCFHNIYKKIKNSGHGVIAITKEMALISQLSMFFFMHFRLSGDNNFILFLLFSTLFLGSSFFVFACAHKSKCQLQFKKLFNINR